MAFAVVIGVVLKVDTIGHEGVPPLRALTPINEERGQDGFRRFVYDLSPADCPMNVEDACARLGSRLERMLPSPESPLPEGPFAARLTLEFGLLADRAHQSFSYAWPAEFLRVLADADIELSVTHYLSDPDDM